MKWLLAVALTLWPTERQYAALLGYENPGATLTASVVDPAITGWPKCGGGIEPTFGRPCWEMAPDSLNEGTA